MDKSLNWHQKEWTDDEMYSLLKMSKQGMSYAEMGKALNRTVSSIAYKMKDLRLSNKLQWTPAKRDRVFQEVERIAKRENVDVGSLINQVRKQWYGYL